jgi:cytochrome P450/NADPH-cytochrome P450 reductase
MPTDNTTSLIVAFKGTADVETNGHIIRYRNNVTYDFLRKQIADKLSILGGSQDIQTFSEKDELLTDIDQIKNQKVVYVDLKQHIITQIPGPRGLPFVGALYELLPDM